MPRFTYGGQTVEYTVKRSLRRKKTISIKLDPQEGLVIYVPSVFPEAEIIRVLEEKWAWVWEKYEKHQKAVKKLGTTGLVTGRRLLYLGSWYTLKLTRLEASDPGVLGVAGETILVNLPSAPGEQDSEEAIHRHLHQWYTTQASQILPERVKEYAERLKLSPSKITVRDQRSRWGSCSRSGSINLNWRLVMAPIRVIDYVVVHELVHMMVMDHSPIFWHMVEQVSPDYKDQQDWLRQHAPLMRL